MTCFELPESMDHVNNSVRAFLEKKPPLETKISLAEKQVPLASDISIDTPDLVL